MRAVKAPSNQFYDERSKREQISESNQDTDQVTQRREWGRDDKKKHRKVASIWGENR